MEAHVHLLREPVFHERCLSHSESEAVLSIIEAALEDGLSAPPVVLVSLPTWTAVAQRLRSRLGSAIVYDCHDLLEGFTNMGADVVRAEAALFETADFVLFSSEWLAETHTAKDPSLSAKSSILRNAVNAAKFPFSDLPMRHSKRPCAGYVGSLDAWFDVEAIRRAATRHPDWRFVLIGRTENAAIDSLQAFPNVELPGELPHDALPQQMAAFDLAMIPFLPQPLTYSVDPIKLYEYFACGLPVVSSSLPEIERFSPLVYCAADPEEFVEKLEIAMAENDVSRRQERRRVAERESWLARCHSILRLVEQPQQA